MRFALVLVAACWSSTPPPQQPAPAPVPVATTTPPPARASRCATVIAHTMDLSRDQLEKLDGVRDHLDAIREAAIASCEEMHWSDEALRCYGDAPTEADVAGCGTTLTLEQNKDLGRRMMQAMGAP
jgi:hypothetical protein